MKNTFIQAKLIEKSLIRIMIFSSIYWENVKPTLQVDDEKIIKLHFSKQSSMNGVGIVDFSLDEELELGHSYKVLTHRFGIIPVDVTDATTFADFDEKYFYEGNDLGFTYNSNFTQFVLWAPLASKVVIKIKKESEKEYSFFNLKREDKGIFRITLGGDYKNALYKFLITNNETTIETVDPYAKGSTLNGKESVVIDFSEFNIDLYKEKLPILSSYNDAIIYETHVRDFSISNGSDIEHKGKFLGIAEENRKSIKGHKVGLDYLKDLGITHLQLLPIYDYKTVDENNPDSSYNWGYDPDQYFVPEGSYGSNSNPTSRIRDLKILVSKCHENGIRVSMDVVFNHVYEYQNSVLEKVVPHYYFRRNSNDSIIQNSGCGNDLASEKPMVKKLILDAVKFWVNEYGIDALRFDLMGLIDNGVLNEIKDFVHSIDPSFMLYGEGWEMGAITENKTGTIYNHSLIPSYAFFNDEFRENLKYYFVGDDRFVQTVKSAYLGNCVEGFIKDTRFSKSSESINYVECHDNETLYDFIAKCDSSRSIEENLDILDAINCCTIFSFGIPFVHMGQEIGQSKYGEGNTYNKGDYYNKFSFKLLDERYDHYLLLCEAIKLRKSIKLFHLEDSNLIDKAVYITDENHVVKIDALNEELINPYSSLTIYMNPNKEEFTIKETNKVCLFSSSNKIKKGEEVSSLPAYSFIILVDK